ncbi:MAG: 2-dehydro-3-deoxygalactonokinase [Pseudomonadota bacterium]
MSSIELICGNWGTTTLRAFGVSAEGEIVTDVRTAPGIASLSPSEQESTWFETVQEWGNVPHLICGMAGSNLGWLETGYVETPASAQSIADEVSWKDYDSRVVGIVPGLSGKGWIGQAERMRGEETELVGWLQRTSQRDAILCLPGTHTKWVTVEDGSITRFNTALTGELFSLLKEASILKSDTPQLHSISAFETGARLGLSDRCSDTLHGLFSARSELISGGVKPHQTEAFLSGFLIARDISGALETLKFEQETVHLIGEETLANRFAHVLTLAGVSSRYASSERCVAAGLFALAKTTGHL